MNLLSSEMVYPEVTSLTRAYILRTFTKTREWIFSVVSKADLLTRKGINLLFCSEDQRQEEISNDHNRLNMDCRGFSCLEQESLTKVFLFKIQWRKWHMWISHRIDFGNVTTFLKRFQKTCDNVIVSTIIEDKWLHSTTLKTYFSSFLHFTSSLITF